GRVADVRGGPTGLTCRPELAVGVAARARRSVQGSRVAALASLEIAVSAAGEAQLVYPRPVRQIVGHLDGKGAARLREWSRRAGGPVRRPASLGLAEEDAGPGLKGEQCAVGSEDSREGLDDV